jgi:hypothetical protein
LPDRQLQKAKSFSGRSFKVHSAKDEKNTHKIPAITTYAPDEATDMPSTHGKAQSRNLHHSYLSTANLPHAPLPPHRGRSNSKGSRGSVYSDVDDDDDANADLALADPHLHLLNFNVRSLAAPAINGVNAGPTPRSGRQPTLLDITPTSSFTSNSSTSTGVMCPVFVSSIETRCTSSLPRPTMLTRGNGTHFSLQRAATTGALLGRESNLTSSGSERHLKENALSQDVLCAIPPLLLGDLRFSDETAVWEESTSTSRLRRQVFRTEGNETISVTVENVFSFPVRTCLYVLVDVSEIARQTNPRVAKPDAAPATRSPSLVHADALPASTSALDLSTLGKLLEESADRGSKRGRAASLEPTPSMVVQCISIVAMPQSCCSFSICGRKVLRIESVHGWFRAVHPRPIDASLCRSLSIIFERGPQSSKWEHCDPYTRYLLGKNSLSALSMGVELLTHTLDGNPGKVARSHGEFRRHDGSSECDWQLAPVWC